MSVSFQGCQPDISCMSYLSEGHFFCGTSAGYFKFRLWESNTNDPKSPYLQTLLRNEEWSTICHIEMVDKNEYDPKELVVVSSIREWLSVINLYRRGITLDVYNRYELGSSNAMHDRAASFPNAISRISNMNTWSLGSNSYLVMSIGRSFKILKVISDSSDQFEEEKIPSKFDMNHDAADDLIDPASNIPQFDFKEVFSSPSEAIFTTVMKATAE